MRIYNGWVLRIEAKEFKVIGSLKIRGKQSYILSSGSDKVSLPRHVMLKGMNDGSIEYIRSEAP